MSLKTIANDAAAASQKRLEIQKARDAIRAQKEAPFLSPGFRKIEQILTDSGFAVESNTGWRKYSKNGLYCEITVSKDFETAPEIEPVITFARSDKTRYVEPHYTFSGLGGHGGYHVAIKDELANFEGVYDRIQSFIMENLPQISQTPPAKKASNFFSKLIGSAPAP